MRLIELAPNFVRYESRIETWQVIEGDPDTWRARGCPTKDFTGPKEYEINVDSIGEAQGVSFLCPACFKKNGGKVGTHGLSVTFEGRGVPVDCGSQDRDGKPSRWKASGTGVEDLTLKPSVDIGCWHGYITNGEITNC